MRIWKYMSTPFPNTDKITNTLHLISSPVVFPPVKVNSPVINLWQQISTKQTNIYLKMNGHNKVVVLIPATRLNSMWLAFNHSRLLSTNTPNTTTSWQNKPGILTLCHGCLCSLSAHIYGWLFTTCHKWNEICECLCVSVCVCVWVQSIWMICFGCYTHRPIIRYPSSVWMMMTVFVIW